jgi:pyridine nucleotide-disulfide oxidoreductase family protein
MKRLVLAGGGHAHLHVLKTLAVGAGPDVEVVLISPHARQVYSGMLPGWIAGHYRLDECAANLLPLARAAGVRFVQDHVIGLDARRRIVRCAQAGEIGYDALSLDIGAQADTSCLVATDALLLPIRPIERFIVDWSRHLEQCLAEGRARVAVVGGGAAGVELALAIRYRLIQALPSASVHVTLVEGRGLLAGHGAGVVRRLARILEARGVVRITGQAAGVDGGLLFSDGHRVETDCVIAATGVAPPAWLADSRLALAQDGFVAVGEGQQSISHANVFAGGDIASRVDKPHAKSGVYAVRSGPILAQNLARHLSGHGVLPHAPQRRSLYLLATGPRHAVASWGGLTTAGDWVWRWKDWIDRRFMKQYRLAGPKSEDTPIDTPGQREGMNH